MGEQFIEKLMALKVELMHFLDNEVLEMELEKAYRRFKPDDIEDAPEMDRGFNDWIIHDYEFEGGHRLIDLYRSNHPVDGQLAEAFSRSRISYYQVANAGGKQWLKDLFDHSDYALGNAALLDETAVVFARLYPFEGQYYFLDEYATFDQHYREYLMRGIMTRFTEARDQLGYLEIGDFLRRNTFLLYLFSNIIDDLYLKDGQEDGLEMFSSVYAVTNHEKFMEIVKSHFRIRPLAPEQGIYQLFDEEGLLGEIVDLRDRVEFEYITREAMQTGKEWVETIFGEILVHLEDAVVTLDDLL